MGYSWPTAEAPLKKSLIVYLQEADSMQLKLVGNHAKALNRGRRKRKHFTAVQFIRIRIRKPKGSN